MGGDRRPTPSLFRSNIRTGATRNGVKYVVDKIGGKLRRGGIMPVVGAGTGTSDKRSCCRGQTGRAIERRGRSHSSGQDDENPAAVQAVEGIIEATNSKASGQGAWVGLRRDSRPAEPDRNPSGVWRTGNNFTQRRTPGHPSGLLPSQQRLLRRLNHVSAQPVPTQTPTTNIIRNGNGLAAPPSLSGAGVDVARRSAGAPRHWSARRPQSTDHCHLLRAGHADFRPPTATVHADNSGIRNNSMSCRRA